MQHWSLWACGPIACTGFPSVFPHLSLNPADTDARPMITTRKRWVYTTQTPPTAIACCRRWASCCRGVINSSSNSVSTSPDRAFLIPAARSWDTHVIGRWLLFKFSSCTSDSTTHGHTRSLKQRCVPTSANDVWWANSWKLESKQDWWWWWRFSLPSASCPERFWQHPVAESCCDWLEFSQESPHLSQEHPVLSVWRLNGIKHPRQLVSAGLPFFSRALWISTASFSGWKLEKGRTVPRVPQHIVYEMTKITQVILLLLLLIYQRMKESLIFYNLALRRGGNVSERNISSSRERSQVHPLIQSCIIVHPINEKTDYIIYDGDVWCNRRQRWKKETVTYIRLKVLWVHGFVSPARGNVEKHR